MPRRSSDLHIAVTTVLLPTWDEVPRTITDMKVRLDGHTRQQGYQDKKSAISHQILQAFNNQTGDGISNEWWYLLHMRATKRTVYL